jgi:hypothetical protein
MATLGTGTVPAGGPGAGGLGRDVSTAALVLARRLAAGATMWCVAPGWPEHARHVAVEFVHPVIMGKRALPAVAVDAVDAASVLRASAEPGDVVVAIGPAGPSGVADLLVQARSRGLVTVWIGAGARPPGDVADHLLWVDGADPEIARHDGTISLCHHLLWELTHVCFEHPGLLAGEAGPPDG